MAQRQAGHGQQPGMALGSGHDMGFHPAFKYLLYCVETKYSWDWEMYLGSLSGAVSVCGCRRGAGGQPAGVQGVCTLGWGPPLSATGAVSSLCSR